MSPMCPSSLAPRHSDVWENRSTLPRMLNIDARWRRGVSSTLGRFTHEETGNSSGIHWIEGWVGCSAILDSVEKGKLSCPCRELNKLVNFTRRPTNTVTDWLTKKLFTGWQKFEWLANWQAHCLRPRHRSGGESLAFHRGGPRSIPCQVMLDMWWI
jgi:hypothetical protein